MRKHISFFTTAAITLALLCGCKKEIHDFGEFHYSLNVALDSEKKTSLGPNEDGKRKTFWENGDCICCNGSVSAPLKDIKAGTQSANFEFKSGLKTPFHITSPESLWKDESCITLPAVTDHLVLPMVGCSDSNTGVGLKAATAVAKFNITGSGKISYIELSSDRPLSGDFSCNFSSAALTPTNTSKNTVRLNLNADLPLEAMIQIPEGEYGLTVKVVDNQGKYMDKETGSKKNFTRGIVHSFPSFEYVPTGTMPVATFKHTAAYWEINTSTATSAQPGWTSSNKLYATHLDGASKAYISTFSLSGSPISRVKSGNNIAAGGFNTGDGFEFTYPSVNLAAGTTVDFMATFLANSSEAPKYWLFEYYEDGVWKTVEKDLRVTEENATIKYSFYVKYFKAAQYTNFQQNFTLVKPLVGDLKMRCRVVGGVNGGGGTLTPTPSATIGFVNLTYRSCVIDIWENCPIKDSKSILCIGNSFTYYHNTNFFLNEIARSQGHEVVMNAFTKGGQYFSNQLVLEMAQEEVMAGGYDYAILQDQSGQHSRYYSDMKSNASVLDNTNALVSQVRQYSPSVQPILENTWAYKGSDNYVGYGSYDAFASALKDGALLVADKADTWLSPICEAFQLAYSSGITNLYDGDNKHPNRNGAYLKSCVNYLLIYGEPFDSNVPDCLVDKALAASLRDIAQRVVLPKIEKFRNPDSSGVKPGSGEVLPGGGDMDPATVVDGENGIATAQQLRSFAYRFNTGGDISSYCNAKGEVVLLDDIDLDYVVWMPVGSSTGVSFTYDVAAIPTYPFKGVFNGNGFSIKGLRLDILDNKTNVKGLFGATLGATIKNLDIEGVKLNFTSTGISANNIVLGTITGYGYNTTISNVHISGLQFSGKATSTAGRNVSIGGIVGQMVSIGSNYESSVTNCSVMGSFTNDIGEKYTNDNTANIGGIVGTTSSASTGITLVKECTNNASMDVKTHRVAGIVAVGFKVHIEDCINHGDITSAFSSSKASSTAVSGVRHGGILGYCSSTSKNVCHIKGCINYGTMRTNEPGSAVGGVIGLIRCFTVTNCHNYGNVVGLTPNVETGPYRGLLVGAITSANDPSVFTNCSLKGSIGAAMDGSDAVAATADNYLSLGVTIKSNASCPSWSAENITFIK